MRRKQRLRHWKQKFRPGAEFVWAKCLLFGGALTVPGRKIPKKLSANRNKVRRFWDSGAIQLAKFIAPDVATGQSKTKAGQTRSVPIFP